MYKVLATKILGLINDGRLTSGTQLPPTRELAKRYGLSRDVVVQCYGELASWGVVEVVSTKGTFVGGRNVAPKQPVVKHQTTPVGMVSDYCHRLSKESDLQGSSGYLDNLNFGAVPINLLPSRTWNQLLRKHCITSTHISYKPDVLGRIELRRALQAHLKKTKGIECTVEQIVIWSQSQNALNTLCRVLLNAGDSIAIEEPGFGGIKDICKTQGVDMLPIPVDESGIDVDALERKEKRCQLLYVTPSHQDPTGVRLSNDRRDRILKWAKASNAWLIEDDYDGLFSYENTLSTSLFASSNHDHVIYTGSFWKLLYPLTPLGFTVLPRSLVDVVVRTKLLSEPNPASLDQLALAALLNSGKLSRHLSKVQKIYAEQRRTLIFHLCQTFGNCITLPRQSAGSHQLVRLHLMHSKESVVKCGLEAGLGISSTHKYYLTPCQNGEFIIDFGCLPVDRCGSVVQQFKTNLEALVSEE